MKILKEISKLKLKTKIIISILTVCLIGIASTSIVLISKNIKEDNKIIIEKAITININEKLPKVNKYIKKKGSLSNDLKINYGSLKDTSNVGTYKVIIKDVKNNKKYTSKLNIVDKDAPELKLKDVKVEENSEIKITDFIESCTDNSNKECIYYYVNDNGEKIDDIEKSVGTRIIKIIAKDENGNKTKIMEANLEVTKKQEEVKTTTNKNNISQNNNVKTTTTKSSYDPEQGCYKTPESNVILAYKFPCGVTSKEAYARLEDLKANYFKPRISKLMSDNSYGHGSNFNAGYYMISAKYNGSYVVGIHVPFSLMDTVDKVSSYGYLKEDGTASWVYYREAGR